MFRKVFKDRRVLLLVLANFSSAVGAGIAGISITFLILDKDSGEEILGSMFLAITIILFFLSPYIGVIIDRYSRKKLFLFNQMIGFCLVTPIAIWGLINGYYYTWQLVVMLFTSPLYFALHFPTLLAFVQEIFDKSTYKSLSGIMEVESQAATLGAGGLAGILIGVIDYPFIFLFDGLTYLISFLLVTSIPYVKKDSNEEVKVRFWSGYLKDILEGFYFLKRRPLLILFLLCSLMPFLTVMVANYLKPIFIDNVLNGNANILGFSSMTYALGAIAAGISVPYILNKLQSFWTLIVAISLFTLSIFSMVWLPMTIIFLIMTIFQGWGNAGTRVVRRTLMLELIPNKIIGRVNTFFNTIGLLFRIAVLGTFTSELNSIGVSNAWMIMGTFLVISFLGVVASRSIFFDNSKDTSIQETT
jgi:MFS family permease